MGVDHDVLQLLASLDLDVAHAGLSTLRFELGSASSHQSVFPRPQHMAGVPGSGPNDRRVKTKRVRRGPFCLASASRRIGGVAGGTQGRSEHLFLAPCNLGLCTACRTPWVRVLSAGAC